MIVFLQSDIICIKLMYCRFDQLFQVSSQFRSSVEIEFNSDDDGDIENYDENNFFFFPSMRHYRIFLCSIQESLLDILM